MARSLSALEFDFVADAKEYTGSAIFSKPECRVWQPKWRRTLSIVVTGGGKTNFATDERSRCFHRMRNPQSCGPLRPAIDFAWIATHRSGRGLDFEAVNLEAAKNARKSACISAGTPPESCRETKWKRRLTRIWERVLRTSPIGMHDNFFDLGGDSLLAVRILADLKAITNANFRW